MNTTVEQAAAAGAFPVAARLGATPLELIVEAHQAHTGDRSDEVNFAYLRLNRKFLTDARDQAGQLAGLLQAQQNKFEGATHLSLQMSLLYAEEMCYWNCSPPRGRAAWVLTVDSGGATLHCEHPGGNCVTTGVHLDWLLAQSESLTPGQIAVYSRQYNEESLADDLQNALEAEDNTSERRVLLDRAYAPARAAALEATGDDGDRDAS